RGWAGGGVLGDVVRRPTGQAGVRYLLVIGGDEDAAGPYADALTVIQKGDLRRIGIVGIGIGAYPEGHPRIPLGQLEASLDEKIASATAQGLRVHTVSQFSFSGEHIIAWLKRLRSSGIKNPVGIGLAGPTSVPALIRYAKRCGVTASLRGLMSGAATGLVANVGPDRIINMLNASRRELGETHLHYFSFGGVVQTARYANDTAQGRGALLTERAAAVVRGAMPVVSQRQPCANLDDRSRVPAGCRGSGRPQPVIPAVCGARRWS